jgi:hypothetical protein
MKNQLARIFCLFMAFQVLFASTGFAMYEHFCKIKGEKTYSLSVPKKRCCLTKKANNEHSKQIVLKRAKCCSDHIAHYKITPNASQNLKGDLKIPSFTWISTSVFPYDYAYTSVKISFNSLHYSNNAPPLAGRDRLIFIQSFLI